MGDLINVEFCIKVVVADVGMELRDCFGEMYYDQSSGMRFWSRYKRLRVVGVQSCMCSELALSGSILIGDMCHLASHLKV